MSQLKLQRINGLSPLVGKWYCEKNTGQLVIWLTSAHCLCHNVSTDISLHSVDVSVLLFVCFDGLIITFSNIMADTVWISSTTNRFYTPRYHMSSKVVLFPKIISYLGSDKNLTC